MPAALKGLFRNHPASGRIGDMTERPRMTLSGRPALLKNALDRALLNKNPVRRTVGELDRRLPLQAWIQLAFSAFSRVRCKAIGRMGFPMKSMGS